MIQCTPLLSVNLPHCGYQGQPLLFCWSNWLQIHVSPVDKNGGLYEVLLSLSFARLFSCSDYFKTGVVFCSSSGCASCFKVPSVLGTPPPPARNEDSFGILVPVSKAGGGHKSAAIL